MSPARARRRPASAARTRRPRRRAWPRKRPTRVRPRRSSSIASTARRLSSSTSAEADGMATILLVTHASDRFHARSFLVQSLFEHWASAGHEVIVRGGPRGLPAADVAFLHADGTEIPAEYTEALARYPVVVNGKTGDVTKRAISRNLVNSPADFQGPVIVKTNRNSGGFP